MEDGTMRQEHNETFGGESLGKRTDSATMVAARPQNAEDPAWLRPSTTDSAVRCRRVGTALDVVLRRDGALQIRTTVAIVRALLDRLSELHAARASHGALSTSTILLESSSSRATPVSVSIEGLIAATTARHLPSAAEQNDVTAVGDVLIKCLLGLDTTLDALERALENAPLRATSLLEIGLEALRGNIASADAFLARIEGWESAFGDRCARRPSRSDQDIAATTAA